MPGNDSYTVTLLHLNTDFIDSAAGGSGHIWTAYGLGPARIVSGVKVFGAGSCLFNSDHDEYSDNVDEIETPYSSDYDFGTGDWTIDWWARWSTFMMGNGAWVTPWSWGRTIDTDWMLFGAETGGPHAFNFRVIKLGSDQAYYVWHYSLSLATWYHLELSRNGSDMYFFINGQAQTADVGVPIGTKNITLGLQHPFRISRMGTYANPAYHFQGWVDEFRVSKGICRHTSNFTPPTDEYNGVGPFGPTMAELMRQEKWFHGGVFKGYNI